MTLLIQQYAPAHEVEVARMNARFRQHGSDVQFPETSIPELPRRGANPIYEDYFTAVDDEGKVRGGYILKYQEFLINGGITRIAHHQLPLSEGIIDRKYAPLGILLIHDAQRREPRLVGVGGGGAGSAVVEVRRACGWSVAVIPFYFRVVRPARFLSQLCVFQRSAAKRFCSRLAAVSGLGSLAIHGFQGVRPYHRRPEAIRFYELDDFGTWADELWERAAPAYKLVGVRDRAVLAQNYSPAMSQHRVGWSRRGPQQSSIPRLPTGDPQRFIRICVTRHNVPIGWAIVLATSMNDDQYFGNLRVGTIADAFAHPDDALAVIACARDALLARDVDLLISNQSHASWCQALQQCGFTSAPSNFAFVASKQLASELAPFESSFQEFHLNRGDGDGPINL